MNPGTSRRRPQSPLSPLYVRSTSHLWDLSVQRVLPGPPAPAVLAPPWGLPGLEARLSRGAPGAPVCLEMPSCARGASGPGGRRVWLWSRRRETHPEGGAKDKGQDGDHCQPETWGQRPLQGGWGQHPSAQHLTPVALLGNHLLTALGHNGPISGRGLSLPLEPGCRGWDPVQPLPAVWPGRAT